METLFVLLFLVSVVVLIIGLIKPTVIKQGSRKNVGMIFGGATVCFFIAIAVTSPNTSQQSAAVPNNSATVSPVATEASTTDNQPAIPVAAATPKQAPPATPATNAPQPKKVQNTANAATPAPAPVSQTAPTTPAQSSAATPSDRESVLATLKANASAKWGTDYQMVKYEYDQQVAAYDWVVAQTKYPDIMAQAEQKWANDYSMVKYEYNNQVAAYEWINAQTAYPDIMAAAKQKWGTDYQMVKYEYNNQVSAYKSL